MTSPTTKEAMSLPEQLDELLLAVHAYENAFVKTGANPELLADLIDKRKQFLAAIAAQGAR